jgi:hypothetical protein
MIGPDVIRRLEENTPRPTNGHPTVARGHPRGRGRIICCPATGLDVDISWLPTARSERNDANMRGRFRISSPHSEREQAIEEGAIASQCLPQILGGGLLVL